MLGSRKPKLNQTALFTSPGAAADERLKQRYGTNQKGNRIITGHNNSGFDALVLLRRDQQLLQQRSVSISRFPHRWAAFSFLEYYMSSLRKEKQNAICSHTIIKLKVRLVGILSQRLDEQDDNSVDFQSLTQRPLVS